MARSSKKKTSASPRSRKAAQKPRQKVEDAEILSEEGGTRSAAGKTPPKAGPEDAPKPSAEPVKPAKEASPKADAADKDAAPAEDAPFEPISQQSDEAGAATPPPAEKSGRGGVMPLLFGGVVAGAIGFGASQYSMNGGALFGGGSSKTDELTALVGAQKKQIDALSDQLSSVQQQLAGLPGADAMKALSDEQKALAARVDDLSAPLQKLSGQVEDATRRIGDLEMRPVPDGSANAEAVRAYETQLAAMREMLQKELEKVEQAQEAGLARIEQAQKEAQAEQEAAAEKAHKAAIGQALAELQSAAGAGEPFAQTLAKLGDEGVDVPAPLADLADTGIPTLEALKEAFPPAAREAIVAATREAEKSGETGKLTAFLRTQLGARSLTPRDGNDPDAILSRAEAALKAGDLKTAIQEVSSLPDAGKEKMTGWLKLAGQRDAALEALAALAAQKPE